jgi:palmitoyltransferase ZDHHC13/17
LIYFYSRNGNLATVTLLLNHGADPTVRDGQGFNALHLAVHSMNSMLVLLLIYTSIDIDTPDSLHHTPLMWAAYQGDQATADILLRHGASISKIDNTQFTALHWAIVKGNKVCIRKVLEAGADAKAKEENGKTPDDMAKELNKLDAWQSALSEAGRRRNGELRVKLFEEVCF